ncbi:MAG: hypothetical protein KDB14_13210 [Planctomycetales bacterium]|nr:hypothetical protein [Planctomycetales bacterium]
MERAGADEPAATEAPRAATEAPRAASGGAAAAEAPGVAVAEAEAADAEAGGAVAPAAGGVAPAAGGVDEARKMKRVPGAMAPVASRGAAGLQAIVQPRQGEPQQNVVKLIETLRSLGVDRMSLSSNTRATVSSVVLVCPAHVTLRKVQTILDQLKKLNINVEVRLEDSEMKLSTSRDAREVDAELSDPPATATHSEAADAGHAAESVKEGVFPVTKQAAGWIEVGKGASEFRAEAPADVAPADVAPGHAVPATAAAAAAKRTPPADDLTYTVAYQLKHLTGNVAKSILDQLYGDALTTGVFEERRSLVIRSNQAMHREVEELLEVVDRPVVRSVAERSASDPKADTGAQIAQPGAAKSAAELDKRRSEVEQLERLSRNLASRLRGQLSSAFGARVSTSELRDVLGQVFDAKQRLQQAELEAFSKRLSNLEQSLDARARIRSQVIERRLKQLLQPELAWEPEATAE